MTDAREAEEAAALRHLTAARRERMKAKRVVVAGEERPATSRRLAPEQHDVVSAALAELPQGDG
jgi:hypothetical protein